MASKRTASGSNVEIVRTRNADDQAVTVAYVKYTLKETAPIDYEDLKVYTLNAFQNSRERKFTSIKQVFSPELRSVDVFLEYHPKRETLLSNLGELAAFVELQVCHYNVALSNAQNTRLSALANRYKFTM